MVDPTPTPEPTPAVKTRKQGVVNKKQQKSLAVAEKVTTAAVKDEYAATLETEHEITPDFIAQLAGDCVTARGGLGQVVEHAVTKRVATGGKAGTKKVLMKAIRKIQAAAKQKYSGSQPAMLADYYVGDKIDANQDTLEQVGTAVLDKISPPETAATGAKDSAPAADVLPGVTAGKIAALAGALDDYTAAWKAQTTAQSDKQKGHIAVAALVNSIDSRRRIVQFAVDGEWTFDDAANAPIRREFGLPVKRPFNVVAKNTATATATPPAPPAALKRKAAKPAKAVVKVKKVAKAAQPAKRRKKS
jgi:hypothetical protein